MYDAEEILIIDDDVNNLRLLVDLLKARDYLVRPANGGELGLLSAKAKSPSLILLDIGMPEIDGYEVCRSLKATPELADIPVIFLSAYDHQIDKVKAFEVGGVDYITKPFEVIEVLSRVETHLKLRKRELKLQETLDQQAKYFACMEELQSEFLSTAVHDLKNPLSAITSNLYVLDRLVSSEHEQEVIARIRDSAQFMNNIISDMLTLARIEARMNIDFEEVLLETFIHQVFYRQTNGNFTPALRLELPESETIVTLNPLQVERAIGNLLSNAIKFTPATGTVTLELIVHEDSYVIKVEDTGLGIPPQNIPHLFDKFFRHYNVDDYPKGTGLGLSIVKAVVEQHYGQVYVESELNKGTCFTIHMPTDIEL